MKKAISILSVLALTLVFSGTLFAQTQVVDATATVEEEITLTKNSDIAFGTVQQNTTATLDPNGSNSNVGSGANIGDIDISASASTGIVISWNSDAVLGDGSSATMGLSEDVDGRGDGTDDASGSSDLTSGSSVTTDSNGNYYLYLGGSISVASSQTTGSYSTSNSNGKPLTVEVQYQ